MKNRTTNQLGLAPMRIPNTRASWIEPAPTPTSSHRRPATRAGVVPPADRPRGRRSDRRRVAFDDRRGVDARGKRAVGEAARAAEARGAERVGDGGRGMADEQRALEREREVLDEAAGAVLEGVGVPERAAQPREVDG